MVDRFWLLTHSVFAIEAGALVFARVKRFGTSGNWYLSTSDI